jgi:hypothetical protein
MINILICFFNCIFSSWNNQLNRTKTVNLVRFYFWKLLNIKPNQTDVDFTCSTIFSTENQWKLNCYILTFKCSKYKNRYFELVDQHAKQICIYSEMDWVCMISCLVHKGLLKTMQYPITSFPCIIVCVECHCPITIFFFFLL